jgi:hypothetical protein
MRSLSHETATPRNSSMRSKILPFIVALTFTVSFASAQTEQERSDARELFKAGIGLQDTDPAKALEKFQSAQKLYKAPTITLHIAQCQAKLLKLVEAVETYRDLDRTPRQDNWSADFKQAQEQGRAELTQVEARIPKLVVNLDPQPPGVKLQLDGAELASAFIGVPKPVNPGKHRVVAFAPNYGTAEQTVDVKEKATETVTLKLLPGVSEVPVGTATTPPPVDPNTTTPVNTVPVATTPTPVVVPNQPKPEPNSAFMLGGNLGFFVPFLELPTSDLNRNVKYSDIAGPGLGAGLSAGVRLGKLTLSAAVDLTSLNKTVKAIGAGDLDVSNTTLFAGAMIGYLTSYTASGAYLAAGLGYRVLNTAVTAGNKTLDGDLAGADVKLELGYSIHFAKGFRAIPMGVLSVGQFSNKAVPENKAIHGLVGLALGVQYDVAPLGK